MRMKFETVFRACLHALALCLAWSLWAAGQTSTNKSAITKTNQPSALTKDIQRMDERYLTFWLDRVDFLRENTFLGEPLWKYPASLIYILLAFYGSKLIDRITCVWLRKLAAKTETKLDD